MGIKLEIDILKKYDKEGPRYTSYPSAPIFSESFTAENYKQAIINNNGKQNTSDISLYFHIPFCNQLCYFCACNMMVTRDRGLIDDYLNLLFREISLVKRELNKERKVGQMHWGGGSPSYLTKTQVATLFNFIRSNFDFTEDAEIGIEIDPRDLTADDIPFLAEIGFNRLSMGVQDFNPQVQKAVNRVQPEELTTSILKAAKNKFKSVNIDLIYGLPYQTVDSFSETICKIIQLKPDRIAMFNFAYLPNLKKHQKLLRSETLPKPEEKLEILINTVDKLTSNGYIYIGMDHFALQDDELSIAQKNGTLHRNFQGYSTKAGLDLYAFGITSISFFGSVYTQNVKTIPEYKNLLAKNIFPVMRGYKMTEDDIIRHYVIMNLMCHMHLSKHEFSQRFGLNFDEYFEIEMLQPFIDDGLIINTDSEISVSYMGRFVIRNIAMCFDRYIGTDAYKGVKFSRTV